MIDILYYANNYRYLYYYKSTMIAKITTLLICIVLANAIHKMPGFPWSQVEQVQ